MEVDFAFLADGAEAVNGKVHVVGGAFDTIWAGNVPVAYPRLSFVMRLFFSAPEIGMNHKVEIHIMDEDGKRIAQVGGDIHIKNNPNLPKGWKQGFLSVLNFAGLKFDRFGDYSFNLLVNNSCVKTVTLRVAQIVPMQQQFNT